MLGRGLTVVCGPNGAGKSNLLEGLYFGCTARSSRTANERELVRIGEPLARVTVETEADDGRHVLEVGLAPGEGKRIRVDGAPAERLEPSVARPLVSVFMPERLGLVKGPPGGRRAHLDRLIAALWPARAEARASYARALAQRNALVARVRAGSSPADALDAWDAELARHGVRLIADRSEAVDLVAAPFRRLAAELGLPGAAEARYRPRSTATDAEALASELAARRGDDIARGFTVHGPHRDDVDLLHDGRRLRSFGSQGQQRVALLALLLAEREALSARRGAPLMLLDDVMSELDEQRRERLAGVLREGGQAVVTATEPEHVPGARDPDVALLYAADGVLDRAPQTVAA